MNRRTGEREWTSTLPFSLSPVEDREQPATGASGIDLINNIEGQLENVTQRGPNAAKKWTETVVLPPAA